MKLRLLVTAALTLGLLAMTPAVYAAPGTKVVDSTGKLVGYQYGTYGSVGANGSFERQIAGNWYTIIPGLTYNGLMAYDQIQDVSIDFDQPIFYYTSSNCTGTIYLRADSMPPLAYLVSGATTPPNGFGFGETNTATVYFPKPPYIVNLVLFSNFYGGLCQDLHDADVFTVGQEDETQITVTPPLSIK